MAQPLYFLIPRRVSTKLRTKKTLLAAMNAPIDRLDQALKHILTKSPDMMSAMRIQGFSVEPARV